jgi:formylglycine-generating enzyme required for sulfatase activity
MGEQRIHHRVFIASPSDVKQERQAVEDVIREVNRLVGRDKGIYLEPYLWEIDALPSYGRPQDLINPDVDSSSIIVVIFWSKVGTPTGEAMSGTLEELDRSIKRYMETGEPHVMVYFCSRQPPELNSSIKIEQWAEVMKLKEEYSGKGICKTYETTEDFKDIMRDNLSRIINTVAGQDDVDVDVPDLEDAGEPITSAELQRYFNQVRATCGQIVLTGLLSDKSSPTVPLDDVYVSLSVTRPNLSPKKRSAARSGPGRRTAGARIAGRLQSAEAIDLEKSEDLKEDLIQALVDEGVPREDAENSDSIDTALRRVSELDRPPSTEQVRDAIATLSIEDAFRRCQHLLVEGIPGSGKSTILMHITMALVKAHQGDDRAARLLGFSSPFPVPVFVPLRYFWRWFHGRPDQDRMFQHAEQLVDFLIEFLGPYVPRVDWIVPALERGEFVVLFDGMDEVPDLPGRGIVARIILDFVQRFTNCRFALTSRPAGLSAQVINALSSDQRLAHCKVRPLNELQIRSFVQAWYRALMSDPREAERRAFELIDRIKSNPRVGELTETPILLTAIAVVHQTRGELPERRADLYEHCVRAMCSRWDLAKGEEGRALAGVLDEYQKLGLFEEVAASIHQNGSDARVIERGPLLDIILRHLPGDAGHKPARAKGEALLEDLVDRTGLIIPDGEISYRFQHLSFQEYLVVRYISDRVEDQVSFLLDRLLDPWWREIVLMSPAYKAMYATVEARAMIERLADGVNRFKSPDDRAEAYGLLSRALLDLCQYRVRDIKKTVNGLADSLVPILNDTSQPGGLAARVQIAKALGLAGDPRLADGQMWQEVPGGKCFLVEDDSESNNVDRSFDVSDFLICRWPVTVGEYKSFVDSGGYRERKWWSPSDWDFLKERDIQGPLDWEEQIENVPNVPVVGVSWPEANAYAAWLRTQLSGLDQSLTLRLPTEAEWVLAARGAYQLNTGTENPMPRRVYSWGDVWAEKHANCGGDNFLGELCPVGCFPAGNGPYGVWDQIGNIWEWCLDWHAARFPTMSSERDPVVISEEDATVVVTQDFDGESVNATARVAKGGSFTSDPSESTINQRIRVQPWFRQNDLGFRCAASRVKHTS